MAVPNFRFVALAGGFRHGYGLTPDGYLSAEGSNSLDQRAIPCVVNDPPVLTGPCGIFSAVDSGHDFGVALRSDGSLEQWGANDYGQFNNFPPPGAFKAITAGEYNVFAIITSDGPDINKLVGRDPDIAFQASPPRLGTISGIPNVQF